MTARTLQGMARVRSGQAPAWTLVLLGVSAEVSRIKRDFACTFTPPFPPVLVALRPQSRLMLEGRTRTLSGPSPDLSPAKQGYDGIARDLHSCTSQPWRWFVSDRECSCLTARPGTQRPLQDALR